MTAARVSTEKLKNNVTFTPHVHEQTCILGGGEDGGGTAGEAAARDRTPRLHFNMRTISSHTCRDKKMFLTVCRHIVSHVSVD